LNERGQLSDSLRQDEIVDVNVQPAMSEENEEFQSAGVVGLAPLTEKSTETTDAITKSQSLIHELETLLKEYAGVGEEASQAVEEDCPSCIGDKLQASNMDEKDEKDENHVAIQSEFKFFKLLIAKSSVCILAKVKQYSHVHETSSPNLSDNLSSKNSEYEEGTDGYKLYLDESVQHSQTV
jgi:hypothetical protein